MKKFIGNRPASLPLLQSAFREFQLADAAGDLRQLAARGPSEEQLQALTDEEINDAFRGVVRHQTAAERRLKDRLHGVTK